MAERSEAKRAKRSFAPKKNIFWRAKKNIFWREASLRAFSFASLSHSWPNSLNLTVMKYKSHKARKAPTEIPECSKPALWLFIPWSDVLISSNPKFSESFPLLRNPDNRQVLPERLSCDRNSSKRRNCCAMSARQMSFNKCADDSGKASPICGTSVFIRKESQR